MEWLQLDFISTIQSKINIVVDGEINKIDEIIEIVQQTEIFNIQSFSFRIFFPFSENEI